jgi:hypothetical protein
MTTIIGIQGDGYAVIGCDTRISSFDDSGGVYQISTLGPGSSKIAPNGKYLLGAAGDMRAINILHHVFQPPIPTPGLRGKKLDSFITVKFIPSLRSCFESQGYSAPDGKDDKDHIAEQGSSIVVVVNATIYIVDSDYSWVSENHSMYATGSGSSYALGALSVLSGGKKLTASQARNTILKALTTSAKFDPYTGGPFQTFVQEAPAKVEKNDK